MPTFTELSEADPIMAYKLAQLVPTSFWPSTGGMYSYSYLWSLRKLGSSVELILNGQSWTYADLGDSEQRETYRVELKFEIHFQIDHDHSGQQAYLGSENDTTAINIRCQSRSWHPLGTEFTVTSVPMPSFRQSVEKALEYKLKELRDALYSDWENSAAFRRLKASEANQRSRALDKTLAKLSPIQGACPIKLPR